MRRMATPSGANGAFTGLTGKELEVHPQISRARIELGIVSADPVRAVGLLSVFDGHPRIHAVCSELKTLVDNESLHYILMDVCMMNAWIDTLFFVRRLRPDIRQIILGPAQKEEIVMRAIVAGGRAFLDECCEPEQILQAVDAVVEGSIWAPRRVLSVFIDRLLVGSATRHRSDLDKLTQRERQVLGLILEARSNREIAEDLSIEERTVKAYVASLMRKTGVQNRVALSMLAAQESSV